MQPEKVNFKKRDRIDNIVNYLLFFSIVIAFATLAALIFDILSSSVD